ncbi:MAG: ECF transporter S component [Peptoniphilaceae bacterium]|uniref:ECF transporter S component n=1 Tax=Parvimonas sp. TaxID=1944660 RepID=UPI0025E8B569|nr:ECF transporter S component [Parvimonas sp.]MCI5997332.1 ECF transporter S component [Parvimonas sp.]MDD7765387.1 ECF transporter S component [Peptoniphilaceae bacterium]MDY3050653.1 ECF transporter S component [Parvimonas sp.]
MNSKKFGISEITKISILSAISVVLMLIKIPLPFAPTFMEMDIAELPALIGGFAMGPLAGFLIVCIKIVLNIVINGTKTFYVGELSNLIVSSAFVLTTAIIYQKHKNRKGAFLGLIFGSIAMSFMATISNYFFIFPLYANILKIDLNAFVGMVAKINPLVKSYFTLMMFSILPFNLVKTFVTSIVTAILYKKISPILKRK